MRLLSHSPLDDIDRGVRLKHGISIRTFELDGLNVVALLEDAICEIFGIVVLFNASPDHTAESTILSTGSQCKCIRVLLKVLGLPLEHQFDSVLWRIEVVKGDWSIPSRPERCSYIESCTLFT